MLLRKLPKARSSMVLVSSTGTGEAAAEAARTTSPREGRCTMNVLGLMTLRNKYYKTDVIRSYIDDEFFEYNIVQLHSLPIRQLLLLLISFAVHRPAVLRR